MGATTATTFECDRCDSKAVMPQGEQPKRWGRAVYGQPPLANPMEDLEIKKRDDILCRRCSNALLLFLDGAKVEGEQPGGAETEDYPRETKPVDPDAKVQAEPHVVAGP